MGGIVASQHNLSPKLQMELFMSLLPFFFLPEVFTDERHFSVEGRPLEIQ